MLLPAACSCVWGCSPQVACFVPGTIQEGYVSLGWVPVWVDSLVGYGGPYIVVCLFLSKIIGWEVTYLLAQVVFSCWPLFSASIVNCLWIPSGCSSFGIVAIVVVGIGIWQGKLCLIGVSFEFV